jgi:hypothetical protein
VRGGDRRGHNAYADTKLAATRIAAVAARRAAVRRVISPSPFPLVIRIRKLSVRLHSSIKHSLWASLVRIEHILVLIHILHLCVNRHHGYI